MIREDGYTAAAWPWPLKDAESQRIEREIADWLIKLKGDHGEDVWRYGTERMMETVIEFRNPEDALAFKLMVPPSRRI